MRPRWPLGASSPAARRAGFVGEIATFALLIRFFVCEISSFFVFILWARLLSPRWSPARLAQTLCALPKRLLGALHLISELGFSNVTLKDA